MLFRKKKTDEEIVNELRNGNTKVVEEFYASGFASVKKYVLTNNGNADDAKDIYQEAIIVLLQNCNKPDFSLSTVEGYLYGISTNMWMAKLRKEEKTGKSALDFYTSLLSEEENNWIETMSEKLSQLLQTMGEPCRQLLEYYYYMQMSMKQIAVNMQYKSDDIAKTQKNRCMNKLRALLKEETGNAGI